MSTGSGLADVQDVTSPSAPPANDVGWLLSAFVQRVPGVREAAVVSADGLLLAVSQGLMRTRGDQLAAISSGLISLTRGAARCFNAGSVQQVLVEMQGGFLFVMSVGDGSSLAVNTSRDADTGLVGYEMALLTQRAAAVLTPELRRHLQAALPRR